MFQAMFHPPQPFFTAPFLDVNAIFFEQISTKPRSVFRTQFIIFQKLIQLLLE